MHSADQPYCAGPADRSDAGLISSEEEAARYRARKAETMSQLSEHRSGLQRVFKRLVSVERSYL